MSKKLQKLPRWEDHYLTYSHLLGEKFLGNPQATDTVASVLAGQVMRNHLKAPCQAPRVLIVGKPSTGKSYLVEQAAKLLQLPKAYGNASLLSGPGYKGIDVGNVIKGLVANAGLGGKPRAENSSILIFDELCKIVRRKDQEYAQIIQYSLLPILNSETILVEGPNYDEPSFEYSSKNTLIFCMGVFPGTSEANWSTPEKSRDTLVKSGFAEEFASRFTHFIYLKPIRKEHLKKLVVEEIDSISQLYQTGTSRPNLSPSEVNRVVTTVAASRFGFRTARAEIHKLLALKADYRTRRNLTL